MTEMQKLLVAAGLGASVTYVVGPAIKGTGGLAIRFWRWFTKMPEWDAPHRHHPYWLYRWRWWYNSTPERRLTLGQWWNWHVRCPRRGHHFPRGLPNDVGYWNIRDHWYGVCDRCSGLVQRGSQEQLDKAEREGAPPTPISRKALVGRKGPSRG